MEKFDYGNFVTVIGESILQQTPLQRPVSCSTTAPIMVSHAEHEQLVANIPDTSTRHGAMDGNKTFPSWASDNTGKKYKRETNLKFSEGSVEQYESFRSQFFIHHKMLGWSNDRAGIELYMNLEGKADVKVEEIIMNAKGTSNFSRMWDALDHAFLPIDHRESRYRQFATRHWHTGERKTEYMDQTPLVKNGVVEAMTKSSDIEMASKPLEIKDNKVVEKHQPHSSKEKFGLKDERFVLDPN